MSLTPDIEPIADVVIGSRVAHIMWLEDVTQTDMAKAMRMDQATLSRKLRGERKWSAAEIVRASKVLRIRIGWIFGEVLEARDPEDEDSGIIDDAARPKGLEPLTFWSGVCRAQDDERCPVCGGPMGVSEDMCESCWAEHDEALRQLVEGVRADDLALAADDLALAA